MLKLITISVMFGLLPGSLAHERPVIGILAQENSKVFEKLYPGRFTSLITASYVKWIEAAGARVVPIWIGREKEYYKSLLSKINGVLLPGGNVEKREKNGYASASEIILEIAASLNVAGDFFPVFGIGLGMDMMMYLSNEKIDESQNCDLSLATVSLLMEERDSNKSALYRSASAHIRDVMQTHPVAVMSAKKCIRQTAFKRSSLWKKWIPLSTNLDQRGNLFISSVEHDILPFYGTVFHPEKIPFEWSEGLNIPHTLATVEVSQYFGNFFVNEARKSDHVFPQRELLNNLIQNFNPTFTEKDGLNYFQIYFFNDNLRVG